ncbi:Stp1/IreP family PP2C-type Ser/Thr phosphatase [Pseudalkalibacillus caeni]|uniref:protein-serine/threonine phosphatase n=1 Tax=Exobacillus caeni TaxID=2574798 RepID=A0A5R9F488_9BACL|nr:Stp1/IreP family PP2C-type Ser/Thr phosphatase [Pseudalkalibacillus caeni]TLS37319.1 Stp1/IreP family PP2C-type Ser/Thr phosphatase [Pseudalkalibacillus caeni]
MQIVTKSNTGRVRPHNEDSADASKSLRGDYLVIVADGMGGHRAGDVASSMAVSYLKEKWKTIEEAFLPSTAEEWLVDTFKSANLEIFNYAQEHSECAGMGTTLVAAIVADSFVTLAHVGDSRAYIGNKSSFSQKTNDHSLVSELVRTGQITEDEAEGHPRKHVLLRALGTEGDIKVDVQTIGWETGGFALLCSDGLTNKVNDNTLEKVLRSEKSLEEQAQELIDLANEAGGEDNITVALINYLSLEEQGE